MGGKYRKFLELKDAEAWLRKNNPSAPLTLRQVASDSISSHLAAAPAPSMPSNAPTTPYSTGFPSISASVSHSRVNEHARPTAIVHAPVVVAPTRAPPSISAPPAITCSADPQPLVIYTDGSSRGNGTAGSRAGVGVWWGDQDPRNLAERCPGPQTNNSAELNAIIRALETAPNDRPLIIKSDSDYSIKSLTVYLANWKNNGWRTAGGQPVKNSNLIKYADLLITERRCVYQQSIELFKVAGHSGEKGNEGADALANAGAVKPEVPDRDWEGLTRRTTERMHAALQHNSTMTTRSAPATSSVPPERAAPATPTSSRTASAPTVSASTSETTFGTSSSSRLSCLRAAIEASLAAPPAPRPPNRISEPTRAAPHVEVEEEPRIHGRPDAVILQKELEWYADCLLSDDELLLEAQEQGVM
ncbi:ribonuclease H-like domain-containing protein [Epithele typhae]|uniref:ribonuclease H-like domain-containing protein n=1 Tax=Epithele typhae TaxID=378194 RepID=UPI0020074872|nr:ribonuclease H-like domain-containing protein [Epithele typhae]KAH9919438.1 ribonuclease H-like domain-containing protein [Epithele typhae]